MKNKELFESLTDTISEGAVLEAIAEVAQEFFDTKMMFCNTLYKNSPENKLEEINQAQGAKKVLKILAERLNLPYNKVGFYESYHTRQIVEELGANSKREGSTNSD